MKTLLRVAILLSLLAAMTLLSSCTSRSQIESENKTLEEYEFTSIQNYQGYNIIHVDLYEIEHFNNMFWAQVVINDTIAEGRLHPRPIYVPVAEAKNLIEGM